MSTALKGVSSKVLALSASNEITQDCAMRCFAISIVEKAKELRESLKGGVDLLAVDRDLPSIC